MAFVHFACLGNVSLFDDVGEEMRESYNTAGGTPATA